MADGSPELKPIERYEYKYLIPERWTAPLVAAVAPYCEPDRYLRPGDTTSGYAIHGLYLDSPGGFCYRAKKNRDLDRFKLRIRTYDLDPSAGPLFLEVKRKGGDRVLKPRGTIPWSRLPGLLEEIPLPAGGPPTDPVDRFTRLARTISARPALLVRYQRVALVGVLDPYARVTFDRRIQVQPAAGWSLDGDPRQWQAIDTPATLTSYSPVVLELKFAAAIPAWMASIVRRFELTRGGYSKYCRGVEAIHGQQAPGQESVRPAVTDRGPDRGRLRRPLEVHHA